MNGLDQHIQIVTEHLAQHLINLPDVTLTAHRVAEFALNHREGRLNVRPPMVVLEKFLPIIHEVVAAIPAHDLCVLCDHGKYLAKSNPVFWLKLCSVD